MPATLTMLALKTAWPSRINVFGNTCAALGNLDKALQFYEDYNDLEKELHGSYPSNVQFKKNLAFPYSKLGSLYEQKGETTLAVQYYRLAHDIWAELVIDCSSYVAFKNNLSWVETKLAEF